ncbi:Zinc finger, C3HC4 type (RING finger) [Musa troglodytarum]|uniref:Zinc finger, C3HC4 type (RING finger) n=1 Tax=Musa troglodytarum TaxID=320322 RepID=A0A9E7KA23_9LILI|nr:Zinc finger, C3HC4 type (RING finger) [Musa troglodytarum]
MSGGRGDGGTPRFVQVILGVVGPSQEVAGEEPAPPDRIVLVNPVTQGMVVLQGDPDLMAEILSERGVGDGGRGAGGPPPASKASVEAMRTVDVGEGVGMRQEECPVCLDGLGEGGKEESAAAAGVREMPCGHRFHEGCIVKWLGMHGSCPVCRFRMPPEEGGDPKKGDGEGDGAENEEQRRRRVRGMWLTIVYRRGRGEISDQASRSPGEQGGGGGYSGGDAAASAETDGGAERVDR